MYEREGLVPKALYQKMLVLEEMSYFRDNIDAVVLFVLQIACNKIILILFIRSFITVYIQHICNIALDIFLGTGLMISIILEVVHPGFV